LGKTQRKEAKMDTCKNCGTKIVNTYLVTRNNKKVIACFDCAEIKIWKAEYEPKKITLEQLEKVKTILNNQKGE